jgi:hypothetical protein
MRPKHGVVLTEEERSSLRKKVSSGVSPAREIAHARILLGADEGKKDAELAREAGVCVGTVAAVRRLFAQQGLESALSRKAQPPRPDKRKLTDQTEARLIALACSEAPGGRARWTLRLLADKAVELGAIEAGLSHESVRQALKKTNCVLTESPAG